MWEVLPTCSEAAEVLLDHVMMTDLEKADRRGEPTLANLSIVLVLASTVTVNTTRPNTISRGCEMSQPSVLNRGKQSMNSREILCHRRGSVVPLSIRAKSILKLWLRRGTFPYKRLELILSRRRSNEVQTHHAVLYLDKLSCSFS